MLSAGVAPRREASEAGLRSGGHVDSDCCGVRFQITNVQLGGGYCGWLVLRIAAPKFKATSFKSNVKSGGQECPPHTDPRRIIGVAYKEPRYATTICFPLFAHTGCLRCGDGFGAA